MRRKIFLTLIIVMLLAGIGIMAYPSLANYVNNKFAVATIMDYQEEMENVDEKKLIELMNQALEYNASLPWAFPADPFNHKNIIDSKKSKFKDFEMIQSGAMLGYIEIPDINVYLPIYYGTSDEVLKKGVGLIENTSLPVGGAGTHAVLSAHSGLPAQMLFTDLELLENGDIFFIHVLNKHFAYKVNQRKVVEPKEVQDLMIQKDKDYVSLLTCTPYAINTHRLIVRGERIDYDFDSENYEEVKVHKENDWLWMALLAIVVLSTSIYSLQRYKNSRIRQTRRKRR